jgi:hypothetical protein
MGDQLTDQDALKFARRLKGIDGFPWDDEVIAANARHIQHWCKGSIVDNRVWPAWAQAEWMISQAELWSKWRGAGALKELFDSKFAPKVEPANGFKPLGEKRAIECQSCRDTGYVRPRGKYQYCDCGLGEQMKSDAGDNAIHWLNRMDKSFNASFAPDPRRVNRPSLADLEAEYYASQQPPAKEGEEQ